MLKGNRWEPKFGHEKEIAYRATMRKSTYETVVEMRRTTRKENAVRKELDFSKKGALMVEKKQIECRDFLQYYMKMAKQK